jgi:hypothetical protein
MGYYVQTPANKNKALQIEALYGGKRINKPIEFSEVPPDKALIVVVDNGPFEAAGFAYNAEEFREFTDEDDTRPKEYLLLELEKAFELTKFPERLRMKSPQIW